MKALITGASSGIGRDMARELDKRGYALVLVARDKEKLQEVKNSLQGDHIEIISMDLAKEENCKMLHTMVKDVDILINNAGFGVFGNFTQTDLDTELHLIKTNITAVHILTKLYLQDMMKKNSGHILNVASIAGFMPGPLMDTYYASKAYVVRLTEGIREEIKKAKSNVKISLLCPGPVNTNFNNVAGVEFQLYSLSSERVAQYAIRKMLHNTFLIVPGIGIKIVRVLAKLSPNTITAKFVYKMQTKKRGSSHQQ